MKTIKDAEYRLSSDELTKLTMAPISNITDPKRVKNDKEEQIDDG